jgi:arsenite transporter
MGLGLALGRAVPSLGPVLDAVKVGGVSLPIAVGLFWMMYPVLAKVRYGRLATVGKSSRLFATSLFLNWVLGPILMFALAWLFLPDLPHYRTGLVLIGLARCIAMVLVWNMLVRGSSELAALLVALNSVFQIAFYSILGWLFITVIPRWLGEPASTFHVSMLEVAKSVLLFLGLPLAAGALTRSVLVRRKGEEWYEQRFAAKVGPTALLGLLYTIVLMFALQGRPHRALAARRPAHRDSARSLLRDNVHLGVPLEASRLLLRRDRVTLVHCGWQQLRARDCGCDRALRDCVR